MVVIVTADVELMGKVSGVVVGEKSWVQKLRWRGEHRPTAGPKKLRHQIHKRQPSVVVLDVRFGGNEWLATASIQALQGVRSRPAVVLLAPWHSDDLRTLAADLELFQVLDFTDAAFESQLASTVAAALEWHRAMLLTAPTPPSGDLPGAGFLVH